MTQKSATGPVRWRDVLSRGVLVLVLGFAFALATGMLDGGVGVVPGRWLDQPRFPLTNALPGLLLALALLALARRALFAFGLAFALQALLYVANRLKMANLGTPLLPDDFRIVGQLHKGGWHILAGYLPASPWPYLGALGALVAVALAFRLERPLLPSRPRLARWAVALAAGAALASLLAAQSAWSRLYNARTLWLEPWSAISTADHSGLVSSLVMFHLEYSRSAHEPDRAAAAALIAQAAPDLASARQAPAPARTLPDIVVIQSESFFDPRRLKGYEHSAFTPNLARLAQHGTGGALHVPTFGGGTIRTEFEVLSGLSLRYFDNLQFPYLTMSHKALPGLVRTLARHGYATTALHGNDPAFWNRTTAFRAIGFDRFVSRAAFPADAPLDGKYMADSAMTDEILRQLADDGPPQFLFAISIEAHGPYDVEPADPAARDAIAVPEGIEGRDKLELQNYLYHIGHADHELGRLAAALAKRRRPTLLLFYGDHLPALSNSFHQAGFVDGVDMLAQPDTWLLLDATHPARRATRLDTASWLLPAIVLDRIGLHDDPYFALTRLAGQPLAAWTATPSAPLPAMDEGEQVLDQAMESIHRLRLADQLDALLPAAAEDAPAPAATVAPPVAAPAH